MKKTAALIVILFLSFSLLSAQKISWVDPANLDTFMQDEPRKIFVDLTARWCGWCKVMDKRTFSKQEVYSYLNDNYYALKLDFDENKSFELLGNTYSAKGLAKRMGISGLPGFLFISQDAQTMIRAEGFHKPQELLKKLKAFNP